MAIYRVTYRSMTASYGPNFIEADDEFEAKKKFAGNAFSQNEFGCISARQISSQEMMRELRRSAE